MDVETDVVEDDEETLNDAKFYPHDPLRNVCINPADSYQDHFGNNPVLQNLHLSKKKVLIIGFSRLQRSHYSSCLKP